MYSFTFLRKISSNILQATHIIKRTILVLPPSRPYSADFLKFEICQLVKRVYKNHVGTSFVFLADLLRYLIHQTIRRISTLHYANIETDRI